MKTFLTAALMVSAISSIAQAKEPNCFAEVATASTRAIKEQVAPKHVDFKISLIHRSQSLVNGAMENYSTRVKNLGQESVVVNFLSEATEREYHVVGSVAVGGHIQDQFSNLFEVSLSTKAGTCEIVGAPIVKMLEGKIED